MQTIKIRPLLYELNNSTMSSFQTNEDGTETAKVSFAKLIHNRNSSFWVYFLITYSMSSIFYYI